ncbi:hypothetical protein D3C78_1616550 [compost metagenome]
MELIFFHSRGCDGSATSGNSVCMRVKRPSRVRNSLWPSVPTVSAILAVPMLDENWKISGTESIRPLPWKSLMVKPPMRIG